MPSRRFDQARPFFVLGLVIVAWIILPVAFKGVLRASFFEFQAPITVAASYLRDLQDYWGLRVHSKPELIAAGRDLARVNASFELASRQNTGLLDEVRRLENLLRLPQSAGHRLEHARVVRRDFSGWWQRLVIRKGRNHGIPVGAPVIFSGGVVGRVVEVGAYTAVVELVSSPTLRLAAAVEGDQRPISFQGGINSTLGPPRGAIEFVPLDIFATPEAPRRLVTSGLGGVFPAGFTIGLVTQVEPSTDGLFKTGEVQLDPRLSQLTEVTVLVPLEMQE